MRLTYILLVSSAVISLVSTPASAKSIKAEIESANAAFVKAYNSKNAAGVAAMYDKDAAVLPAGAARIDGRDGIQKYWQGGIDIGYTDLTLKTSEAKDAGNWAYEVGTYTAKYPDKAGKMVDDIGKYVVVWKKEANGKWLLYRDIWNSDPANAP